MSRTRALKGIVDRLRKTNNLIKSGVSRAKSRLENRKKIVGFKKVEKASKNKALKKFGKARGKSNGTIRGTRGSRFSRFKDRDDFGKLPGVGKRSGSPRSIKDMKKIVKDGIR
jgi:hypothetical protein